MRYPLFVLEGNQCDPKKCTGRRLVLRGLAKSVERPRESPMGCIVLTPNTDVAFSPADAEQCLNGILALDYSWRKIEELPKVERGVARALPLLMPVNPTNYGKACHLSTMEALAGALAILGAREQASELLATHNWGPHFLEMNAEPLELYSRAKTSAEVVEAQFRFVERPEPSATDTDV